VAATSTLRNVVHTGRRLTLLNRHAVSARRGLILSGAAGTGKTTALTQLGKTIEVIGQRQHPGAGRIPVVYVTVPPAATPLKYFSERIPATFIFAGVDLEGAGMFTGTRGRQIAGRFGVIETTPFPRTGERKGLIATLEQALRLHQHRPGTLEKPDGYLHQRTGG
jgi:hypothetical protein